MQEFIAVNTDSRPRLTTHFHRVHHEEAQVELASSQTAVARVANLPFWGLWALTHVRRCELAPHSPSPVHAVTIRDECRAHTLPLPAPEVRMAAVVAQAEIDDTHMAPWPRLIGGTRNPPTQLKPPVPRHRNTALETTESRPGARERRA